MRKITGVRFPEIGSWNLIHAMYKSFSYSETWNDYFHACKARTYVRKTAYIYALMYRDIVDA